jgi:hypothetical protein
VEKKRFMQILCGSEEVNPSKQAKIAGFESKHDPTGPESARQQDPERTAIS